MADPISPAKTIQEHLADERNEIFRKGSQTVSWLASIIIFVSQTVQFWFYVFKGLLLDGEESYKEALTIAEQSGVLDWFSTQTHSYIDGMMLIVDKDYS